MFGSLVLTGCASPAGVEVKNMTGQTLRVEYLTVNGDGSTKVYSTGVVASESLVTYKVDQAGGNGVRIRFSLPEAPQDESTALLLKLPDSQTRYYDLRYASGRLVAREQKKWRSESATASDKSGSSK
jgi:hypothetical protein